MVIGIGQTMPVLQLLFEVCMRPCDTVAKHPFTSTCLMSRFDTERRPRTTFTVARSSSVHARIHLYTSMEQNLEAEILKFP